MEYRLAADQNAIAEAVRAAVRQTIRERGMPLCSTTYRVAVAALNNAAQYFTMCVDSDVELALGEEDA